MKRQIYKLKDTAQTDYTTLDPQNLHLFVDESEESGGGGGGTPTLQDVRDENPVIDVEGEEYIIFNSLGEFRGTIQDGGSSIGIIYSSSGTDGVSIYCAGAIQNNSINYPLPTGASSPLATLADITGGVVPDASPTVKGISKLYNDLLDSNIDGGVTQAAIVDGLSSLMTSIDNSLTKDIIEKGLIWQVPNMNGSYLGISASQYLRLATAPITQNIVITQEFGMSVGVIETTDVAGTSGGIRRNDSLNLQPYSNIISVRDFTVNNTISNDCIIIVGFSKNYQFAFPSNAEPTTFTECILVAKLSTSNNLHIVHNDNTGTATSIDLGVNFPANNNLYKYRMILIKESASSYYVQVIKTTLSSGVLLASSTYHLTSDLPTAGGLLQQIMWINNNASAVNMKLGDYGLIIKKV